MKCIGIIAEYNPFHKGHAHHIKSIKKIYPNATIIVAMSGAFVQRGEPALLDKWTRAKCAVLSGADIVVELPSHFAISSAEYFANGAVDLLYRLGIDTLSFGSECHDAALLKKGAHILLTKETTSMTTLYMKQGISYANAIRQALQTAMPEGSPLLHMPNTLLALSYIKRIQEKSYPIGILPIARENNHHAKTHYATHPSASYIRHHWEEKKEHPSFLETMFPDCIHAKIATCIAQKKYVNYARYHDTLLLSLRRESLSTLASYMECTEGLEHLLHTSMHAPTYEELLQKIKSPRYTYGRLNRLLANLLLRRTKDVACQIYHTGPTYARLLAMSENGRKKLKHGNTLIPYITKWAPFYHTDSKKDPLTHAIAEGDVCATYMQTYCMTNSFYRTGDIDFTTSPYIQQTAKEVL